MANFANLKAAINAVIKANGQREITGEVMNQVLTAMVNSLGSNYQFAGVATPSANPGTPDQNVFYMATQAGTYTNFSAIVLQAGISILLWDGSWSSETFFTVDSVPTAGSNNFITSGAVFDKFKLDGGAYDVTAHNNNATFADLSALLNSENLNTLIPVAVRHGGMSIKFVLTSDNKYVQYRLMSDSFNTTPTNWQGVDNEPIAGSENLIKSSSVYFTAEKLNYQKLDKKVGKNLFDKTKRKVGYYIEGNKTESAAPNYSITDYIPVTEGDSIIANKSASYTYNLFYDKNFAPLGNVIASTTSPMTVPVGAEYIRLSLRNADADTFQVEIGTQSTEYEPYTDDAPLTNTEKRLTSVERQVNDIQDELEDIVTQDFILSRTIAVSEWESGWLYIQNNALNNSQYNKHFGKIAVKAGDKIKVTSKGYYADGVNCCLAAFFDNTTDPSDWSDATGFIGYYSDTADTSKKEREIIVPDGTSYVVLSTFGVVQAVEESYIYSLVSAINIPDGSINEDKLNPELRANIGHPKYNTITCKPTGTSGVDADFCGITAIADAINSITDATKNNRYKIHIRGLWHFTNPQDLTMYDGVEYSAIYMKKYVDIEGDGADNSIIFVDFPANANFHSGKGYSDYQPIYHNVESKVSGVKIVGKNCRYAYHIDSKDNQADGDTITIENCTIEYLGHPDYSGSFGNTFGTGIRSGQKWFIKDCNIISRSKNSAFAMHVPLSVPKELQQVNLINCNIDGSVTLHNYQTENMAFVNMIDCNFNNPAKAQISYSFYNGISASKKADYITAEINANDIECVYRNGGGVNSPKGLTLLFKSITTGITSTVRFDVTSSAFNLILGNSAEDAKLTTKYGWDEQYGYIYRDGGVDLAGQAFGTLDIDSNAAHGHTLGNRLGNCSVNNKALKVIVDGTEYTVTFNADYTSMTNAQVVEVINNALDGVATVELFSPAILYYPNVNGLKTVVSIDSGAILKGMGVIFESNGVAGDGEAFGMRRAKNSDGYIDGICLDDTSLGQFGRVITKGKIYAKVMEGSALGDNRQYFTALDNVTSNWAAVGTKAGISLTEDGKFEKDVTPTLLRTIQRGLIVWKII